LSDAIVERMTSEDSNVDNGADGNDVIDDVVGGGDRHRLDRFSIDVLVVVSFFDGRPTHMCPKWHLKALKPPANI
jgi:hypothetical protein